MLHIDHNYRRVMGTPSKYDSIFDFPPDSPEFKPHTSKRKRLPDQQERVGSAPPGPPRNPSSVGVRSTAASVSGDVPVTPGRRGRTAKKTPLKGKENVRKEGEEEVVETVVTEVTSVAVEEKISKQPTASPAPALPTPNASSQPLLESPNLIPFRKNQIEDAQKRTPKRRRVGRTSYAAVVTPPRTSPPPPPFSQESITKVTTYDTKKRKREEHIKQKATLRDDTPVTPKAIKTKKNTATTTTTTSASKRGRPAKSTTRISLPATLPTSSSSKKEKKRRASLPPTLDSDDEDVFTIHEILDKKTDKKTGVVKYLVHWAGYDKPEDHTWEPLGNLDCGDLVRKFEEGGNSTKTPKKKGGNTKATTTPKKVAGKAKATTPKNGATPGSGKRGRPRKGV